jgi:Permease for cytosine/purines, uracil, thiamine, allantoin
MCSRPVFAVLAVYVLRHAHWAYQPGHPLHGTALWATLAGALALIASAPLSYNNSADFSRYLPRATSAKAIAAWTAAGAFIPSVAFTALGALAGTALNMSDPQTALNAILPSWFRPAFLAAIIAGTIANNAMTAYSSGLALQAVGIRIRRSRSVALDGGLGVALTLYALLVSNFLATFAHAIVTTEDLVMVRRWPMAVPGAPAVRCQAIGGHLPAAVGGCGPCGPVGRVAMWRTRVAAPRLGGPAALARRAAPSACRLASSPVRQSGATPLNASRATHTIVVHLIQPSARQVTTAPEDQLTRDRRHVCTWRFGPSDTTFPSRGL